MNTFSGGLPNDWCLANTETSDETTGVDGSETSLGTTNHEDGNTESPENAEEASSPDATDAITDEESTTSLLVDVTHNREMSEHTLEHRQQSRAEP